MQLLYPPTQFSTIGTPATLNRFSCHIQLLSSSIEKIAQNNIYIYIYGSIQVVLHWREYLANIFICNKVKRKSWLRMARPSNCLTTFLPDTLIITLKRYLTAAKRPYSNNYLRRCKNPNCSYCFHFNWYNQRKREISKPIVQLFVLFNPETMLN